MNQQIDYEYDDFAEGFNIYGDNTKAFLYEYEMGYYRKNGKLPDDSIIIDYIEVIDGNLLIVHQDNRQVD